MTGTCVSRSGGIDSHGACLTRVGGDTVSDMAFEVACALVMTSPRDSNRRMAVGDKFSIQRSEKQKHNVRNASVCVDNNSPPDADGGWHAEMRVYIGGPRRHLLLFRIIRKNQMHGNLIRHTENFLLR